MIADEAVWDSLLCGKHIIHERLRRRRQEVVGCDCAFGGDCGGRVLTVLILGLDEVVGVLPAGMMMIIIGMTRGRGAHSGRAQRHSSPLESQPRVLQTERDRTQAGAKVRGRE